MCDFQWLTNYIKWFYVLIYVYTARKWIAINWTDVIYIYRVILTFHNLVYA